MVESPSSFPPHRLDNAVKLGQGLRGAAQTTLIVFFFFLFFDDDMPGKAMRRQDRRLPESNFSLLPL